MQIAKEIIEQCKAMVFDNAYHPYMIVSVDGEILECNQAALDEVEFAQKEQMIGKNLFDFFPEYQADGSDSVVKLQEMITECCQNGFSKFEWQYRDKSDEIVWGEIALKHLVIDGYELMFFSWYDIHEKKVLEHQYELSQESKVQFLSNISHEIKTPMNAIMGFSELLYKSQLNEEQKKYIEAILENSQELLLLINDLLDSSKMRVGHLSLHYKLVSLLQFIKEIQEGFTPRAQEKNLEFIIDISEDGNCMVEIDVKRVAQIVNSLLDNAFKFTKEGYVSLRVEVVVLEDDRIDLIFEVKDSGVGIEKHKLRHIFDVFTQEDASDRREFGGVGLGLSMSRELATMMGGSLSAESMKGEGSSFTFRLNNVKRSLCIEQDELFESEVLNTHASQNDFNTITLSEQDMRNVDDFLEALRIEIIPQYDDVVAKQNFDDYEQWCKKLRMLAQKYNNSLMLHYAEALMKSITLFDIESLNKLLAEFKEIIERLQKAQKERK